MIILSIGSNLESNWGNRIQTLKRAISELGSCGIKVVAQSKPYFSPPMTIDKKQATYIYASDLHEARDFDLPEFYYININLIVETSKPAPQLLYCLKQIEKLAGRGAGRRWASRLLDMDIIDYDGLIIGVTEQKVTRKNSGFLPLSLPHPGLSSRAFVLAPLLEIAPFWHHPITGETPRQLLNTLK